MRKKEKEPNQQTGDSANLPEVIAEVDAAGQSETSLAEQQGRHDGWTGKRMAMFCAVLAETGIVTDACIAVGMSTTSAYSARRRSPLFAAAWEESLRLARDRLADALLERSLNGCVEKYYRDGELVGEKRILDNRLGIQVLKRLDKRAQEFSCEPKATGGQRRSPVQRESAAGAARLDPRLRGGAENPDWDLMLSALRTGDEAMIAEALVEAGKVEGYKVGEVGEVCVAGNPAGEGGNFEPDEPDPRCWWDEEEECWMTDFPPPADFSGYQKGRWGDEEYKRECTPEEAKLLAAASDAELAEERSEDEAARDAWFAQLKSIAEPDPGPRKRTKKSASRPSA